MEVAIRTALSDMARTLIMHCTEACVHDDKQAKRSYLGSERHVIFLEVPRLLLFGRQLLIEYTFTCFGCINPLLGREGLV